MKTSKILDAFHGLLKAYMARKKATEAGYSNFRFFLFFVLPAIPVGLVAQQYAIEQARLHAPIEGQTFPHEPLLKGTYYYEVLRGREHYRSRLDQVPIFLRYLLLF